MITLHLPYPPSVNRYYRHVGAKVLISREGREYRERVCRALSGAGQDKIAVPCICTILTRPPDRRRRDLDNVLKALLDALVHGGALADDSLIWSLHVFKGDVGEDGGWVSVRITEAKHGW